MARFEVRDVQGNVVEERELPEALFGAPVNVAVMHQVVVAGLAAQRAGTQSTKTRAQVRGGGKKPWRQKGTGRARQGSIRSPQWMGGGVAHGPKPRSYEMRVNRKMKKAALRSALSDAAQSGKLALVSGLSFDGPRTKDALGVLEAFGLEGAVLLVIGARDEAVEKSFRNLPQVKIDYPGNLSTYDLLYADRVLMTTAALAVLSGEEPAEPESAPEPEAEGEVLAEPQLGQDETEVGQ
jgi:large subunit ribosomal protein L4